MATPKQDDDEPLELSESTLEALKQFHQERDGRQKQFEDLKAQADRETDLSCLDMELFQEDWNASQFWYDGETATVLAKQLLEGVTSECTVGVISAPSVFVQLKRLVVSGHISACPKIYLLEFDRRFEIFKEFIYYDFENPTRLPADLKGTFDRIICDPPFLSEDCQTKAALTVRWLTKIVGAPPTDGRFGRSGATVTDPRLPEGSRPWFQLILCTGERMESLVTRLHRQVGLRPTSYEPRHAKGLSNEFKCYANFECDSWQWR